MMSAGVLTTKQVKCLREHKYGAEGTSICEPFMQVYWRWLVEQIPLTWAPNTITLVGLIVNIASALVLVYCSPDGIQEAPSWVHIFCAIGLFVYQSLDAIDGKQARRTKSNTPLGELFDHGCDALSTAFVMTAVCVALKFGQEPYIFLFLLIMSEFCFYMAHWQAYVTGSIKFGRIDVTEGQFSAIVIFFISAIYPSFWELPIPIIGLPMRYIAFVFTVIPSAYFIYNCTGLISRGGVGKNKSTVAGSSTIFPVVPIGLVLVLEAIIANKTNIYLDHIALYLLSFGLVTAKISIGVVIAKMTRHEMYLIDSALIGPMMLFLNQYFNCVIPESFLLWIMCIFSAQDLLRFSISVCRQICDNLNIYCFDITSRPRPERRLSNGKRAT